MLQPQVPYCVVLWVWFFFSQKWIKIHGNKNPTLQHIESQLQFPCKEIHTWYQEPQCEKCLGHKVIKEEIAGSQARGKNRTVRVWPPVWKFLSTHLYSGGVPSSHFHSLSCSKSVRPIQWLSLPTICFFIHCWNIHQKRCISISRIRCLGAFPSNI